jgi:hypothetical protein
MNSSTLADIESLELRKFESLQLRKVENLEAKLIENLEAQLIARFSHPLRPKDVQHALIACAASYESAHVRSHLPLLIERDATRRLRGMSRSRLT